MHNAVSRSVFISSFVCCKNKEYHFVLFYTRICQNIKCFLRFFTGISKNIIQLTFLQDLDDVIERAKKVCIFIRQFDFIAGCM